MFVCRFRASAPGAWETVRKLVFFDPGPERQAPAKFAAVPVGRVWPIFVVTGPNSAAPPFFSCPRVEYLATQFGSFILEMDLLPKKVVSGGQTGADQAGLIAAARFGIATGGWMPKGFRTLTGPNPELAARFGLYEHPTSEDYPDRTELNVRNSDGTIRFAANWKAMGEICTLKFIRQHRKPFLDVDIKNPPPTAEVVAWITREAIKSLNVAGNAEPVGRNARAHGITVFVTAYLGEVFEALGHRRAE